MTKYAHRCRDCGWLSLTPRAMDCLCPRCGADRLLLVAVLEITNKGDSMNSASTTESGAE